MKLSHVLPFLTVGSVLADVTADNRLSRKLKKSPKAKAPKSPKSTKSLKETKSGTTPKSSKSSKTCKNYSPPKPKLNAAYMMTNEPVNQVLVFSRDESSGMLTFESAVDTGGKGSQLSGGQPVSGGIVYPPPTYNPLGSQNSLITAGKCLLAVNAGSHSISTFRIKSSTEIELVQIVRSGRSIPVSIAENEGLVYVLNVEAIPSITGFNLKLHNCRLNYIGELFLSPSASTFFFFGTPGQIGFTPENNLIVTNKITPNFAPAFPGSFYHFEIDTTTGLPSNPVETEINTGGKGSVPFSFDFDNAGNLLLVETFGDGGLGQPGSGGGVVSLFSDVDTGTPNLLSAVSTGQSAIFPCWIKYNPKNSCAYTSNNGGHSISILKVEDGELMVVQENAVQLDTPLDIAFSPDFEYLYALSSGHNLSADLEGRQPAIYVYKVGCDCRLEEVQFITDGIPNESERVPRSSYPDVVNGVVGMAVL